MRNGVVVAALLLASMFTGTVTLLTSNLVMNRITKFQCPPVRK